MKKCVIIYNPESGRRKTKLIENTFYDHLEKNGYDVILLRTRKKGDASMLIQSIDKADLVISAGGDGTLNEVVKGNLQREKRLTIANLPMGTTNDFGFMLGHTRNYVKNLDLLINGVVKEIDVCLINEHPFVYVACLGDFINLSYETPRKLKEQYGKFGYIYYGLKQLKKKITEYDISYTIDGETYHGKYAFMFITNASRVAGINNVYDDIKLDDKMFEVAFYPIKNKADIMKAIMYITTTDVKNIPGIEYYQTDNLEIEFNSTPNASWCIDGEEYKHNTNKFIFRIDKGDNKMLVPTKNVEKLFESDEE